VLVEGRNVLKVRLVLQCDGQRELGLLDGQDDGDHAGLMLERVQRDRQHAGEYGMGQAVRAQRWRSSTPHARSCER
jgi:hypothetical protein